MRNINRIPIYINLLKDKTFTINNTEVNFTNITEQLQELWMQNPDLRLTQLLVNTGIIPNTQGFWYYQEDHDLLKSLGFKPRDLVIWGTNFDKEMNELPETIWRPIKELTTDHIETILKDNWVIKGSTYHKYFTDELEYRNNTKI